MTKPKTICITVRHIMLENLSIMLLSITLEIIALCQKLCWCWSMMLNRPFYSCVLSVLAWIESEAGVDLVLIETSLLFLCKCKLVSIRTA